VPWIPDVDQFATAVGDLSDVGVAPLRTDRFSTSTSWLKALEFAARGVDLVRSPSAEYERSGLGMRARSSRDWAKWVTLGIQDADRRLGHAVRACEAVLAAHLTRHTAAGWVAAWQQAVDNRVRTRRKGAHRGAGLDGQPRVPSRSTSASPSSRVSRSVAGFVGRSARMVASTGAGSGTGVPAMPRSSKRRAAVRTERS
jgi:hypothetical protein